MCGVPQGPVLTLKSQMLLFFIHIRDRSLFIPGVGTEEKRKTL